MWNIGTQNMGNTVLKEHRNVGKKEPNSGTQENNGTMKYKNTGTQEHRNFEPLHRSTYAREHRNIYCRNTGAGKTRANILGHRMTGFFLMFLFRLRVTTTFAPI